jgi:hypothetical protein
MLSQILGFATFLFLGIGIGAMFPKDLTFMAVCFTIGLVCAWIKIFALERKS